MLKVEKFPRIFWRGHPVIWDTRQPLSGATEWVVPIGPKGDELRARPNARPVEVERIENFLGETAAEFFHHPSRRLTVLAVTGTNGKTTSAAVVRTALVASGFSVGEIGTTGVYTWAANASAPTLKIDSGFTTPEAPTMQSLLAQFVELGITHVVMEASSHAITLGRVAGIDFDGALFTNLSQDHLDFHGTLANYELAKQKLFTHYLPDRASVKNKWAVVNTRDPVGARIFSQLPPKIRGESFARGETFAIAEATLSGMRVDFGGETLRTAMIGEYNAENVVGAWLLARPVEGFRPTPARAAIAHFAGAPGRLERISGQNVFVDFAHTPDALAKVLGAVRPLVAAGAKLCVVFGCGGDRDAGKRPLMGAIAAKLADRIFVTSDNSRNENPAAIVEEIVAGISLKFRAQLTIEVDRRAAINRAVAALGPGDVCVVAGKGHEDYQLIGTEMRPFSDQLVCAEALGRRQPARK